MPKQKKKFECRHRGFGQYCHRCKPWPERTPIKQLKRLDSLNLIAKKERAKLAIKIIKQKKEK